MFDFLRNWTKSAAVKRQETITAYLDEALTPAERQRFEQQMAQDSTLQAAVVQQQQTRQLLRQLPPRQVPRNFTLDPALYGRPARQPLVTYYPALRAATVLTAVLFFFVIGLNLFTGGSAVMAPAADMAVSQLTSETTGEESADGLALESAPAAVPFSAEETMEDTAVGMAEELEEAALEPPAEPSAEPSAAAAEGGEAAPLPAAPLSPAPTLAATQAAQAQLAPLPTATVSDLPRPSATEVVAERAATAVMTASPPTQPAADTAVANIEATATAVDTITETQESPRPAPSVDLLLLVQVGLLLLLVLLIILTLYARRQRL